ERFGTWSWDRVVQPARELAEIGNWMTSRQAAYFEFYQDDLCQFESTRRYFFSEGRSPLPGTLVRQPDLANTLRRLVEHGPRDFYDGGIARQIVEEIARGGGVIDAEDLAAYQPIWRAPLIRRYLGREIVTAPMPSAGGFLVQVMLGLMESVQLHSLPAN